MPGLQIHPHSRRASGFAVAFLGLLAAGSFVTGLNRVVIAAHAPSPFPLPAPAAQALADAVPDARPAPDMQVAEATTPRARHSSKATPAPDDIAAADGAPPAAEAPAAPAVDASATAPDLASTPPASPPPEAEPPYA